MWRLCLVGLIVAAAGCSSYKVVPVSGQITLDGRPLADAQITFQPFGAGLEPGPGSTGKTDAEGHFSLHRMDTDAPGAVQGRHHVYIRALRGDLSDSDGPKQVQDLVPVRYNAKSTLTFEVSDKGTNTAQFDLTSP